MPQAYSLASEFTDIDGEQGVLAALAADPARYWEVVDLIAPEVFAFDATREAFTELTAALEHEQPIPEWGWAPAPDIVAEARRLADLHQKRLLAALGERFLQDLYGEAPATELIPQFEQRLTDAQQTIREFQAGAIVTLSDLFPEVIDDVRERYAAVQEQGAAVVGLPTGFTRFDKLLGGLQPGLHLLAAEPGQGKTTFALQIAAHVAQSGTPALFVSFEETLMRLALKAICARANLEAKPFADGCGDPDLLAQAVQQHGHDFRQLHLVEGTAKLTMAQVKAKALQVMHRSDARACLIIIDYLQRWASSRRDFSDYRHVVSALTSELRELAVRLDSPVIAISSQNRTGQGKSMLTSLKESGDLEYAADTAWFLTASDREAIPPNRAVDLGIEKNRYGDKGIINLRFRPHLGRFGEV